MNRMLVSVFECEEGDVVAQDIFSEDGLLYVTENSRLSDYTITRLKSLNIGKFYIFKPLTSAPPNSYANSYRRILEEYNKKTEVVKEIVNNLAAGRRPDPEKIDDITQAMFGCISEKGNIVRCLSEMRSFDQYTYNHSLNVSLYAMLIGSWLRLSDETVREIMKAGLLHDIGKAKVPEKVLNKAGKLDPEEYEQIKKHSVYSYELAKSIPGISRNVLRGVLFHHEREDGSGYPMGLDGDKIDLFAKIIAVADVYDALISERVYKKRITPFETFKIFEKTGLGHFDTRIMMLFLNNIACYYIGAEVIFNSGKRGKVAAVLPHSISNPIVNIEGNYIDLSREQQLKIVEMAS